MRSFVIRFGAPLVFIVGLGGVLAARRGVALKHTVQLWADSLKAGSGPLAIGLPFVPAYLEGQRIGSLDSLRLDRHEPRVVDSVRLVIDLSSRAVDDPDVRQCRFELITFDPGEFNHALECATDTAGLVPFGRVAFSAGGEAPLYLRSDLLACAPWKAPHDAECVQARVQQRIQRDIRRTRDRVRERVRARMH